MSSGFISGMINSLKANRKKKRQTFFDKEERLVTRKVNPEYLKEAPEELIAQIRASFKSEQRYKRRLAFLGIGIGLLVIWIAYWIIMMIDSTVIR